MRKLLLFVSAIAVSFAFFSCNGEKEPVPEDKSKDPVNSSDDPAPDTKSNKCDILTFSVLAGETEVKGDVSAPEKKVVLPYYPEDAEAMTSAKAVYTLSDGATISPDPAKEAMDYTKDLKFTITAEDGTTSKEYTVSSREYMVTLSLQKVWSESKTLNQLKVVPSVLEYNTQQFAFVGTDKFVAPDLQVFDLDGNKVGVMNTVGIPSGWVPTSITNDKNGVVLACFAGGDKVCLDDVNEGGIYVWIDGYDKAPEELWSISSSENNSLFPAGGNRDFFELKVGGEMSGDFLVTTYHFLEYQPEPGTGSYPEHGMFNFFSGRDGDLDDVFHEVAHTCHDAGDGNVWQALIPVSADRDGLFVVCDSNPRVGMTFFVQEGVAQPSSDLPLYGTLTAEIVGEEGAEGVQNYGNYSVGDGAVFRFHGVDYLFAASTHWHGQYMTVQTLDPTDDPHFIYETNEIGWIDENRVSAAAVVDPESDTVKLLYGINRAGGEVRLFEITCEVI